MRPYPAQASSDNEHEEGGGKGGDKVETFDTFGGCRLIVRDCQPDWMVLENVLNLDKVKEGELMLVCLATF